MSLVITRDENYKDKVKCIDIHGKYPYKLYLEIKGNSNIGRYIVIVGDKQLNKDGEISDISIRITSSKVKVNTNIVKPNTLNNGFYVTYKVKEVSIIDVGDEEIYVYRTTKS